MDLEDDEKTAAAAAAALAHGVDDIIQEEHEGIKNKSSQAQEQPTGTEVSKLRQMVIQRHNLLESAYEVFAGDGDDSELLNTGKRVARF
ncbi:hypothetical protein PsorP6_001722 [Peronosclerospora sorghi]|uniref:Uncharacterized protein n=1 Tax=Peronosclerospora sorghi TaxID=230839 RepID=A0ACC0WWX7_9STRA|nr:hypothetical protein PsorP6_001722 [Peronosclerospora sorghi]